ncbi:hypothetical protein RR11_555 [Ruegeria sp. R11]|nr:hypothetical protein RR11_555 [Ruegeria sp. R11]
MPLTLAKPSALSRHMFVGQVVIQRTSPLDQNAKRPPETGGRWCF